MREIAEGAGVAKPTIYYYFTSKEGLLARLLDEGFNSLQERIEAINARPQDADARNCLVDTVWAFFEFAMDHPDLIRFIHILVFGPPRQPVRQAIEIAFQKNVVEFQRVLERAVASGLMRGEGLDQAGMALRGTTTNHVVNFLHGRETLTRELAERIVEGFLNGYGAHRSPGA